MDVLLKLVIILPLVALTIAGIVAFFVSSRSKKRSDIDHAKPNWTPFEAIAITVGAYLVTQLIAGIVISIYLAIQHGSPDSLDDTLANSASIQFAFIFLVDALMAWVVYVFIKRRKTSLRAIGLIKPQLQDILYALIGFGAYFLLYMLTLSAAQAIIPGLNLDQKQELGFDTSSGGLTPVLAFVGLVILPPLVEEFLMRGFLFSGLRTAMKFLPAAIITSVVFAIGHLQFGSGNPLLWVAAIDTFTLSMVLVTLREKTGSLWPCIGVHAIKNTLAFLALFVFHVA